MNHKLYPALAAVLGLVGFCVRRWQIATCFLPSGLPVHGPASICLILLTAAAAVALLILTIPLDANAHSWPEAFGIGVCPPLKLVAVAYFVAAIAYYTHLQGAQMPSAVFQATNTILPTLLIAGLLSSATSIWVLAGNGRRSKPEPLAAMLPGFCGCFWLVNTYHLHANDPVVLSFAWQLLAIAASVWAWYGTAGFALERGNCRMTFFWSLLTVFLSLTALADGDTLYIQLLLLSQAVWFTVQSVRLSRRMEIVGWDVREDLLDRLKRQTNRP